ncbi:MAG: hypothetical protein J6T10_08335 [Methanobrevibacter sp.]|nr:hypothetical protein [Methanobrevibacter sp.]
MNNVDEYYNNHELRFIIHNNGYGKENYELKKEIDEYKDRIEKVIKYVTDNLVSQFDIDYIINTLRGDKDE